MRIEHVCINAIDIEKMKEFYIKYFGFTSNEKYTNTKTGWCNYFLSHSEMDARLELLSHEDMGRDEKNRTRGGLVHIAFSLGSKEAVDETTVRLQSDGYKVISGPRTTGDGYYESAILDPEENILELTV